MYNLVKDYLTALKNKGKFSWSELSKLSGLPDATIRKVFSGETADPRLDTVIRLVNAMGGSMDEMIGGVKKQEDISENAVIAIKEIYEARIAEMKASAAAHVDSLKKDKRVLAISACVLGAFLLLFVLLDVLVGNIGWVRY